MEETRDEVFRIVYMAGNAKLPEMVVRVRDRGVDVAQQMAICGYRVEIVPALPSGTLAETGYYTDAGWFGLGSWLEPERPPSLWNRFRALFAPTPPNNTT